MTMPSLAVVVLGTSGLETGRRLASELSVELHARAGGDVAVASLGDHLRALFLDGTGIVFVGAAGALIRLLAPVLNDKQAEPPVVAVAEDASAVIPLLGGHHGANDLARRIGAALSIAPAITTASDLAFGVVLDLPPEGWHLANPQDYKSFMSALLAGETVRLEGEAAWLSESDLPFAADAALVIEAGDRQVSGDAKRLVLHPETLALGVGCERDTDPADLCDLVTRTLADAGLAAASIAGVFSLDLKSDEPAMHAVAEMLNRPARFFDAATLEHEAPRLAYPSDLVFREVGCHGVSEGAALGAAGPDSILVVPKHKSARATCAIARAPAVIDMTDLGQARGRLYLVGIGPGSAEWRTPQAEWMINQATDLVGYGFYLDLLGGLTEGKRRHDLDLGEEEARARLALDLAAEGRCVALISSGDIGIYAMASVTFELLDAADRPDWRRLDLQVAPGISALQACAARIGAPLGHDFCAISLSDLLTPWATIERRVKAASEGDFVIAFYNPVSRRRDWQLAAAWDILMQYRPPETPVIVGRKLGRADESIQVYPLAEFDPSVVDMLSVVMVGSSQSRVAGRWVYTPRGYADKPGSAMAVGASGTSGGASS